MPETSEKKSNHNIRGLIAIVALLVLVVSTLLLRYQQHSFGSGAVKIDDRITVNVDIAAHDPAIAKGLAGRESLEPGQGMLFLFPAAGKYNFWMKGMNFPIDVIWLKDNKIVDLTTDMRPVEDGERIPTLTSRFPADAVLEVPAGFAERHGLKLGLPVAYRIDKRGALR